MTPMPAEVNHYRSSPEFTEQTIPDALLRNHATSENVWARIVILEGSLRYVIDSTASGEERVEYILEQDIDGIVLPKQVHHLELIGKVRFRVDFYR